MQPNSKDSTKLGRTLSRWSRLAAVVVMLAGEPQAGASVTQLPLLDPCALPLKRVPAPARFLVETAFQPVEVRSSPSPGMTNPIIEEARQLRLYDDFMFLSDLQELSVSPIEKAAAIARAEIEGVKGGRPAYVKSLIEQMFVYGKELVDAPADLCRERVHLVGGTSAQRSMIAYTEKTLRRLVKRTPVSSNGSLIPLPFPILIPGSRFQVSFYWDSYFGIQSLLRTGRWELAAMQVENFLFAIENYGLVPNGMRDYYLSRSQPPLLSSMIREVVEAAPKAGISKARVDEWLRDRAYPLLKRDYQNFWMNPETRYDKSTGLNHYWDAKNTPREERHVSDHEETIAKTFRDVRAEAESGRDFTGAFDGQASRTLSVQLNFILFKVEKDLAWMAGRLKESYPYNPQYEHDQIAFSGASILRQRNIDTYLWDPASRTFFGYNLDRKERSGYTTAEIFTGLWAEAVSPDQARAIRDQLAHLEFAGGIAGSTRFSYKQWDAPNGWAPDQFFAISGLRKYAWADVTFLQDAKRIATKWTEANERVYASTGLIWERLDVVRADRPEENGDKYHTQEGFLWTNSVYVWILTEVFGLKLSPD